MSELDWTSLIFIEVLALLAMSCLLLGWYARRVRRLATALEQKVLALRSTPPPAEAPSAEAARPRAYADYLDEQIASTRNRHLARGADRDIALDLMGEAPLERQALALRHAFLIAEKEADAASEGKEIAWDLLTDKYTRIVLFYRDEAVAGGSDEATAGGVGSEEIGGASTGSPDWHALNRLLAEFSRESRDMLGALGTLEQELQDLRAQFALDDADELSFDIAGARQRHHELEDRYVELQDRLVV